MTNKLDNIMVILDHYHLKYKMVEFMVVSLNGLDEISQ